MILREKVVLVLEVEDEVRSLKPCSAHKNQRSVYELARIISYARMGTQGRVMNMVRTLFMTA
jgi:hypothetical protein